MDDRSRGLDTERLTHAENLQTKRSPMRPNPMRVSFPVKPRARRPKASATAPASAIVVVALLALANVVACSRPASPAGSRDFGRDAEAETHVVRAPSLADAGTSQLDAGDTPQPEAGAAPHAALRAAELFADERDPEAFARAACPQLDVDCLLAERFKGDDRARELARTLVERYGIRLGVVAPYTMDGGYRGKIKIVPAVPTGKDRKHLEWLVRALNVSSKVFAFIRSHAHEGFAYRYRHLPERISFFRSVGKRTPAAYASGWRMAYNLDGSINTSAEKVEETFVHEVFHLNDHDHGGWSHRALIADYERIKKRCGAKTGCLSRFAPGTTTVKGGTYYAFQPGNDVGEYAAELMTRYYREQKGLSKGEFPTPMSFQCGAPENQRAWDALRREFFAEMDGQSRCGDP